MCQGIPHAKFLLPLAEALERFLEKPGVLATWDVTLVLHDGKSSSSDVGVIEGDFDPGDIPAGVNLPALGARLRFAFEAISTSHKKIENKDLEDNVERYAAEGIPEYFSDDTVPITTFAVVVHSSKHADAWSSNRTSVRTASDSGEGRETIEKD